MLKFEELEEKMIPRFQGGEGSFVVRMADDGLNRILRGRLEPGCSIGLHRHATSSEIIYVLSGEGKAFLDGKEERLTAGDCHYCKKGSAHTLLCTGKKALIFFAVVPQQ